VIFRRAPRLHKASSRNAHGAGCNRRHCKKLHLNSKRSSIPRTRLNRSVVRYSPQALRGTALASLRRARLPVSSAASGLVWLGRGSLSRPYPRRLWLRFPVFRGLVHVAREPIRVRTCSRLTTGASRLGVEADRVKLMTYDKQKSASGLAGVVLAGRLGADQLWPPLARRMP